MEPTQPYRPSRLSRAVRQGILPVCLAVAGGLVAAFVLDRVLDQAVTERTESSLRTALERLQPELDALLLAGEDPAPRVLSAARLFAVRVTLIAPDGRVLSDSDVEPARLAHVESHADRPEVRAARETGVGLDRRRSATVAVPFVYIARRLSGGHVVRFAASRDQLLAAEAPFRRKTDAVSVAAGLLVGALLVLTRRRHASELDLVRSAVVSAAHGVPPGSPPAVSDGTAAVLAEVRRFADLVRATGEEQRRQLALGRAVFDAVPIGLLVVDRALRTVEANRLFSTLLDLGTEPPAPGTHVLELLRDLELEKLLSRAVEAPPGTRHEASLRDRGLLVTVVSLGPGGSAGVGAAVAAVAPTRAAPPVQA